MPVATGVANVSAAPVELLAATSRVLSVPTGALCGVTVIEEIVTTLLVSPVLTTSVVLTATEMLTEGIMNPNL
jgi:hypothetical protein